MNRYTQQFFSLIEIIYQKVIQRIFDRLAPQGSQKPPQPDSPQREAYSFTEIARRATEEKESEQIEIASIAKTNRNNDRHCNKRRRSKRAKWAEDKSKQDSAYAEAKANGDNEGVRDYWKWIKRYGASTKEYYARARTKRKAAKARNRITFLQLRNFKWQTWANEQGLRDAFNDRR